MRYLIIVAVLIVIALPAAALSKEFDTLGELVGAYSDERCSECHAEIYGEWKSTPHADAVNITLDGLRNFFVYGVKDWWGRNVTKKEVMMCLDCHASVMNYASESLAVKVAEIIVTANDTGDEKEKSRIMGELSRLNVGCVGCHNVKATAIAIGRLGPPVEGAVYGVHGKAPPGHETIKSAELETALFCMQCHGTRTSPDGEVIQCNTLSGSYQHGYIPRGGSRTCQDCHMRGKDRGHRIPDG